MRASIFFAGLIIGMLAIIQDGTLQLGPAQSEAFNPLKYCVNKCVASGTTSMTRCEKKQCAGLKSKSKQKKCARKCNKPEGLLQYCDTNCKKSQMCTRGLEMRACLKEKCDPYKKSDIRRYIKCKNNECSTICKG